MNRARRRPRPQAQPLNPLAQPEQASRWLFGFLDAELDSLADGQQSDLQRQAKAFAEVGYPVFHGDRESMEGKDNLPTLRALRRLQQDVRNGVHTIMKSGWWTPEMKVRLSISRPLASQTIVVDRSGSFPDLFLAVVMDCLRYAGPRIQPCPECGKAFLKIGKQQYCSGRCSQKMRWKRFKGQIVLESGSKPRKARRESTSVRKSDRNRPAPSLNGIVQSGR